MVICYGYPAIKVTLIYLFDLHPPPLWLLVGTFLVIGPELASRRAEHSLLWCMSLYIFDILFLSPYMCNNFYGLCAFVSCWFSAFIRMIIYKFLNVCPFDYTAFAVSGKVGIPLTSLTTSNWVAIFTPTDRHKSVRNRCVIEVLVAFLCCHVLFGFLSV